MPANEEVGDLKIKISMDQSGFQGGISNLNQQMKIVQAEFQAASAKLGGFSDTTEQMNLKAESLSRQIDLQRQKVSTLQDAFEKSAASKGMDVKATQDLEVKYLKAQTQLSNMENQLRKTNAEIEAQAPAIRTFGTRIQESFDKAKTSTTGLHEHLSNAFSGIKTAALGVGATLAGGFGLFELTEKAVDAGDSIYMLSKRLGVTSTEAAKMNQMLKITDTDTKPFISTMLRLDKGLESAGKNGNATTKALEKYGVSLTDTNGKLLPMTEQVAKLAEAYQKAADAGNEDAFVAEILGAKGQSMIPLLVDYKDAKEAAAKVKVFGVDVEAAHEQEVQLKAFKLQFAQFGMVVASSMLPIAQEIMPKVMQAVQDLMQTIKDHKAEIQQAIQNISEAFKSIGDIALPALKGLFELISQHGEATKAIMIGLAGAFTAFKTASAIVGIGKTIGEAFSLIVSPAGLAVLAIGAIVVIGYELYKHWDGIKAKAQELWTSITTTFENIKTSISDAWNAVVKSVTDVWENLKSTIKSGLDSILNFLQPALNFYQTVFQNAWDIIKNVVLGAVLIVLDIVTGNFTQLKSDLDNIWNNIKTALTNIWNAIKDVAKTAWDTLKTTVINLTNTIKTGITNKWDELLAWFMELPGKLQTIGSDMFTSMKNGVMSTISGVKDAVVNGINTAIEWIKALPGEAVQWGKDMIQGLIDGIKSMIGSVGSAVSNVANTIRSYLHFSVPDEGPLTDYESWMPDFMSGLAAGIEKNKGLVRSAIGSLTSDMSLGIKQINVTTQSVPQSQGVTPVVNQYTFAPGSVVIPAKDLAEMRSIQDFFNRFPQVARAMGV